MQVSERSAVNQRSSLFPAEIQLDIAATSMVVADLALGASRWAQ